jgi:hypothetical protein
MNGRAFLKTPRPLNYLIKPCEIEQLMAKVLLATKKKRDHEEKIRKARVREALSAHGLE